MPEHVFFRVTLQGETRCYCPSTYCTQYSIAVEYAIQHGVMDPPFSDYKVLVDAVEISEEQFFKASSEESSPAVKAIVDINFDESIFSFTYSFTDYWLLAPWQCLCYAVQTSQSGPGIITKAHFTSIIICNENFSIPKGGAQV